MTPEHQSADILRQAACLRRSQVDKMAHTVGWPDTGVMRLKRGRKTMKRNPYRNYYNGGAEDPDWLDLQTQGLATVKPAPSTVGECYWRLTDLGKRVVRVRLLAIQEAWR